MSRTTTTVLDVIKEIYSILNIEYLSFTLIKEYFTVMESKSIVDAIHDEDRRSRIRLFSTADAILQHYLRYKDNNIWIFKEFLLNGENELWLFIPKSDIYDEKTDLINNLQFSHGELIYQRSRR